MMAMQKIGRTKTNMRWQFARIGVCIAVLGAMRLAVDPAQAESIPSAEIAELKVFPPSVNLNTNADHQSIVVQAVFANELTRDVTTDARITPSNSDLVRQDANTLFPKADGQSEITVEYGGRNVKVPLVVRDAAADRPISFRLDVMPVFAKAGCNTGSCHGAARGKDGFRLSLFGFDPDGDYQRITREIGGRRINLAQPEQSLLVEKALGQVPHTGGTRFTKDSELHTTRSCNGSKPACPADKPDVPQLTGLKLYPNEASSTVPAKHNACASWPPIPTATIATSLRWRTSCRTTTFRPQFLPTESSPPTIVAKR